MKISPLQLPWASENVPHAILDILRGCNIHCRDCYNSQPDHIKSLTEIEAQLDTLMDLRKLQSISIVGGEITLHPDLVEIVRRVRRRKLFAELFTNGVGLDDNLLTRLKEAGTNVIFLHIEPNQRRPDLPAAATAQDVRTLRSEKAALVAAHGIEVGLSITAYPDRPEEVEQAIRFIVEAPHVCYLLVTWWRDVNRMPLIRGDLAEGMFSNPGETEMLSSKGEIRPGELCCWLDQKFGFTPFAVLGSNVDASDARWLSFMVGTMHQAGRMVEQWSVRPTWLEKAFLEISRALTGHYPFYQEQRPWQIGPHLLLNGLVGGGLGRSLSLLARASQPGTCLGMKRLLFQWPATFDELGRVVHCRCCPDAVLREGRLVPLCISDRIISRELANDKEGPAVPQF